MRLLQAIFQDVAYQFKYGFYLLYGFFSVIYIGGLLLCPVEYKKTVASLIILSDPAMLGSFFIGGIWLLEKGEGLHGYRVITPLRNLEYIVAKAGSLALIAVSSVLLITAFGLKYTVNYWSLIGNVFFGSLIFTTAALIIATYARSVNHYLLLIAPLEVIVTLPALLAICGLNFPLLELLPGMAVWRLVNNDLSQSRNNPSLYLLLAFWLILIMLLGNKRLAMVSDGQQEQ